MRVVGTFPHIHVCFIRTHHLREEHINNLEFH